MLITRKEIEAQEAGRAENRFVAILRRLGLTDWLHWLDRHANRLAWLLTVAAGQLRGCLRPGAAIGAQPWSSRSTT